MVLLAKSPNRTCNKPCEDPSGLQFRTSLADGSALPERGSIMAVGRPDSPKRTQWVTWDFLRYHTFGQKHINWSRTSFCVAWQYQEFERKDRFWDFHICPQDVTQATSTSNTSQPQTDFWWLVLVLECWLNERGCGAFDKPWPASWLLIKSTARAHIQL